MLLTAIQNKNFQLIQYLIHNRIEFVDYFYILESLKDHTHIGKYIQKYLIEQHFEKLTPEQKKTIFYYACENNLLPIVEIFYDLALFKEQQIPLILSLRNIQSTKKSDVFFFLILHKYQINPQSFICKLLKKKEIISILFHDFNYLTDTQKNYFLKPSFFRLLKYYPKEYTSFSFFVQSLKIKKNLSRSLSKKDFFDTKKT